MRNHPTLPHLLHPPRLILLLFTYFFFFLFAPAREVIPGTHTGHTPGTPRRVSFSSRLSLHVMASYYQRCRRDGVALAFLTLAAPRVDFRRNAVNRSRD